MRAAAEPQPTLHPELVYQLTRAVSQATQLEEILEAALNCLNGSLQVSRSSLLLFGEDNRMHFRAWRNLSDEYRRAVDGHSPWAPETKDPEPVLIDDVRGASHLDLLRPVIEAEGIRALAFFPLASESRLLGKFMVYHDSPHHFSDAEIMVARTIAAQVAFAVEQQAQRNANSRLEALNHAVIDALGVAVYTTDADGTITRYNSSAAALWGRHPVIGEEKWCGSWKLYWPDGEPMAHEDCPMGVALKEQRIVRGQEILVDRPDGVRCVVQPYPSPVCDVSGRLIGAINVLIDVTAQYEARSELQAALVAKDDFLGLVSHELRTPLTQLLGNASILSRRWKSLSEATLDESFAEMLAQSQRLQRLVDNMLVLSRLERGITPETEPHLVQRLFDPIVEEFGQRFPGSRIEARVSPNLPPVETNAGTIDQVLWNLLTNAQKYGAPNGLITLEAKAAEEHVLVTVSDEGDGVKPDDMDRLFQPYFRSSTSAERTAGLGLGLSVCKTLVEMCGGQIWAKRLLPRGMQFGFSLPMVKE
jgi:K+-sensing histidine kinase KdpD